MKIKPVSLSKVTVALWNGNTCLWQSLKCLILYYYIITTDWKRNNLSKMWESGLHASCILNLWWDDTDLFLWIIDIRAPPLRWHWSSAVRISFVKAFDLRLREWQHDALDVCCLGCYCKHRHLLQVCWSRDASVWRWWCPLLLACDRCVESVWMKDQGAVCAERVLTCSLVSGSVWALTSAGIVWLGHTWHPEVTPDTHSATIGFLWLLRKQLELPAC